MRVGIVGAGAMGAAHAAGWKATDAQLVGIVSAGGESAAKLAASSGARAYEDVERLLPEVDVVDLCVPTDLHRPLTLQAAAAGVHVVCEKPIALNVADGREMIEACERAGVRLFIAMVLRFFPQYREAARLIAAGTIGNPGVLRLKRVAYMPHAGEPSWYHDQSRSGGMLVDLMIHDFDYARHLAGEVVRVHARAGGRDGRHDYALVTLRFASGAMALVEGGWANPPGVFRTGFDLAGSHGLIEWNSESAETIRHFQSQAAGTAQVGLPLSVLAEDPYTAEIRHVRDALETGARFEVTPQDALHALRIALAAKESLSTGRPASPMGIA